MPDNIDDKDLIVYTVKESAEERRLRMERHNAQPISEAIESDMQPYEYDPPEKRARRQSDKNVSFHDR